MKGTLTEIILSEHLVEGDLKKGNEVAITVDDTLTQDATGTMTWLQFESIDEGSLRTRAYSFIDHNTLQVGFENADDH
ncbi:aconitate hydratase, partial [Candidatus Woesearchaeota archaeon]|nr:aconitate hydratase [Candidatus Woesearchaeota archaeon]